MTRGDLEARLHRARERVSRALEALKPKHRGGEMEEYAAAHREQLEAERALALSRGELAAMALDWSPAWDTGAPCPHLVSSGHRTLLVYLVADHDPAWDGTTARIVDPASPAGERLALVEFVGCYAHRFGGPNDEVLHSHPLYGRGLQPYGAHLVANSPWIAAERCTNSVHGQFRLEPWEQLRHYLLLFHDDMFECLAREHSIEFFEGSFEQAAALAISRLFAARA
jgi:hypothetical protein